MAVLSPFSNQDVDSIEVVVAPRLVEVLEHSCRAGHPNQALGNKMMIFERRSSSAQTIRSGEAQSSNSKSSSLTNPLRTSKGTISHYDVPSRHIRKRQHLFGLAGQSLVATIWLCSSPDFQTVIDYFEYIHECLVIPLQTVFLEDYDHIDEWISSWPKPYSWGGVNLQKP